MKLATVTGLLVVGVVLSGCGFSIERYRYPCQDPANWQLVECTPPECEANGLCTKYTLEGSPLFDTDQEQADALITTNIPSHLR
jgi:hypothetical protein